MISEIKITVIKKIIFVYLFISIYLVHSFAQTPKGLKLLNEYVIPFNQSFKNTTIGGLSAIDFDKKNNVYYFISDDRSDVNPARAYKANITISSRGIDTIIFTDVITFHQFDNTTYPNSKTDPAHTPDPESIRYNPITNQLIWSSEGERIVKKTDTVLENPAITIANINGKAVDSFPMPEQLYMHSTPDGPRQNGVLEGLTFTPDYKTLYASVEEPLYQDGNKAGLDTTQKTYCRFIKYNVADKTPIAQYAYPLDAVAYKPNPAGSFMINGISEIMWVADNQFIVMERSYSTGRLSCTVKLYIADVSNADNINNIYSLKQHPEVKPATKKLLLNMDSLNRYIDNIEGITFGPLLPNGHRTLLVVSDNNFLLFQKTQVMVFEVE